MDGPPQEPSLIAQVVSITGNRFDHSRPLRVEPTVVEPRMDIQEPVGAGVWQQSRLFSKAIQRMDLIRVL